MLLQLNLKLGFFCATALALVISRNISLATLSVFLWTYGFTLTLVIFYVSWIYPFYLSPLRHIPTIPGFPLWGHLWIIISTENGVIQRDWHQKYGPIVRFFFPFGLERLSVASDDAIKQMMHRVPYNYPKPYRVKQWLLPFLGDGVLLAEGEQHMHQRKVLAPAFSTRSIKALTPVFSERALRLSESWYQQMMQENVSTKSIEVLDWLGRATTDIIGKAGFGIEIRSLENPKTPIRGAYQALFKFDTLSRALHAARLYTTLFNYVPFKANRDIAAASKMIADMSDEIIREKHREVNSKENDVIALIVRTNMASSSTGADKLDFDSMRGQVMTFLGAGHDTTATSVAWTLHLIAKYPTIQDTLRSELKEHMPSLFSVSTCSSPDYLTSIDPDTLSYLDDVVRESLRYIPPISQLIREALADDILCGYTIPAGTMINICINATNRMPWFWGETANVFDPGRWDKLPKEWSPSGFMSFSHGPRGCIGKKFAETEIKWLLCVLVSRFRFEVDEGVADPEECKMWRLVLRPRDGVTLKVGILEAEK